MKERLESLKSEVLILKSKTKEEILQLDSEVINVKDKREENLMKLLKLRMQLRQYESEEKENEKTEAVKHEDEQHEKSRMDAADFIQKRLFLLYRLKFKNKPKASQIKKKKSKGGKKK